MLVRQKTVLAATETISAGRGSSRSDALLLAAPVEPLRTYQRLPAHRSKQAAVAASVVMKAALCHRSAGRAGNAGRRTTRGSTAQRRLVLAATVAAACLSMWAGRTAAARPTMPAGETASASWAPRTLLSDSSDTCECPVCDEVRVVGGRDVDPPGRYPFIVNLVRFGVQEFCGGSLIAPNVVLTAAHCDLTRMSVWIGRHNLREGEKGVDYEELKIVDKAYPEPRWDPQTNDNDIMLLRRAPLTSSSARPRAAVHCSSEPREATALLGAS